MALADAPISKAFKTIVFNVYDQDSMKGDLAFRLFDFYHLNCGGFPSLQL